MNTIIMNQDVHTPAFIKADASNKTDSIKQQPTFSQASPPLLLDTLHRTHYPAFHRYRCHLAYLEDCTPQVVTAVSVIAGFLILRFIVRVILKVTITLLSILFWLAILCAILLCVL